MIKSKTKRYVIEGICALLLIIFSMMSYLLTKSLSVASNVSEDYIYVSNEILNNAIPVIAEEESAIIGKPFSEEGISIAKYFYDPSASQEEQEKAIFYYEDTYIQNTGVDYNKEEEFSVQAVLDGRVIAVTTDDINGTTVKIEHENNIVSIYQSLGEVNVNENDTVSKGEVIGKSGENALGSDLGKHLHFELSINNVFVNPESYYGKTVNEL